MSRSRLVLVFLLTLVGLLLGGTLRAQTYALQLVDNDPFAIYDGSLPLQCIQIASGINDLGHLVGQDAGCGGFVRIGTSFKSINYPGAGDTNPLGINNDDTIVGWALVASTVVNFSWSAGNFTTISVPGVSNPHVTSISNNGIVTGFATSGGFILQAGNVTPFNCSGGMSANVGAVNNAGQVVGSYFNGALGTAVSFLYSNGMCTTFAVGGASETLAWGINDTGQISGTWLDGSGDSHGFRRDPNGQITTFDFSDDSESTFGRINNEGQVCGSYFNTATGATYAFVLSASALVDPVPDLITAGAAVTTDVDLLGSLGRGVVGVSADGVTQVVVRIFATAPGLQFSLKLFNDHMPSAVSSNTGEDGALGVPGGTNLTANQITVTAQNTNAGPQAFAIYQAPIDFMRASGTYATKSVSCQSVMFGPFPDDQLACREVTIQVQGPTGSLTIPVQVVRPPVVAVHGLWSNGASFVNFFTTGVDSSGQPIPDSRFGVVEFVNYDTPVGDFVTSTDPDYGDPRILTHIHANSLGFQYNVASVKHAMAKRLSLFKGGINPISAPVAAVQVDVVAHSMGGVITRTLALSTNEYFRAENYAAGDIHKLITIATPHLGTPLAIQFLENQNSCVRGILAAPPIYNVSVGTAVLMGDPSLPPPGNARIFGAIGDMQGDGLGGPTSSLALENIATAGPRPIPTAFVGGIANASNLAGLDSNPLANPGPNVIRSVCMLDGDPLAQSLNSSSWPNVFGQADSDGVVPLTSQLNRVSGFLTTFVPVASLFNGAIHSPGVEVLGFLPPTLLDCCSVPQQVINLLNTPVTDPTFNPTDP